MIEARSVSKQLGSKPVLTEVSLSARDGEVTGFVGPNGAGKTTLMKVISGLLRPDSGEALVDGAPFADAEAPGRTLGVHLNGEWLPARQSGVAHLRYVCDTQSVSGSRVRPMLETVGLWGPHERPAPAGSCWQGRAPLLPPDG